MILEDLQHRYEGLKQRITLLLTVGGGFEPPADFDAEIAKQDVSHD